MIGPWDLRDILVVTTMSSGESQTCLPLQSWSVSVYIVHPGFYSCSLGILGRLIPRVVSMGVRKMTCNMSQRHPLWLVVLWPVTNKKKRWMPGNGTSNQGYRWSKRRQVGKLQVTAGRVQQKWHCLRRIWPFDMQVDRCHTKRIDRTATYGGWPILQKTARVLCSVQGGFKSPILSLVLGRMSICTGIKDLPEFVLPKVM